MRLEVTPQLAHMHIGPLLLLALASTRHSPFYLIYGRQLRIVVDAFLDIGDAAVTIRHATEYVSKLENRLSAAYEAATKEATAKAYKKFYNQKVKNSAFQPGGRLLVKKVGLNGSHK